jgi:hypothetical protein
MTPHQSPSNKGVTSLQSKRPVVTVPTLKNTDETIGFDRFLLESNPTWSSLIRRCFPFELPPGLYEKLAARGSDVCVIVSLRRPGELGKGIITCSLEQLRANPQSPIGLHGIIIEIYNPTMNEKGTTAYENN